MEEERRRGSMGTKRKKENAPKSEERGWGGVERKKRREHKQEDNINPESAVKLQALSTHIYLSVCLFSFLTPPFSPEIFPLSAWNKQDQMVPETDTKQNPNTVKYNIHGMNGLYVSLIFIFYFPQPFSSSICVCVCASLHLLVHSDSIQAIIHDADPAVFTWQHKQWHQRLEEWDTNKSASCCQSVCKSRCQSWMCVCIGVCRCVSQTCPRLSKLYFRRAQRYPACRHWVLLVMLLTSSPSQWKNFPLNSCIHRQMCAHR